MREVSYHPPSLILLPWSAFLILSAECADASVAENHQIHAHKPQRAKKRVCSSSSYRGRKLIFQHCYRLVAGWIQPTAVTQATELQQPQQLFWGSCKHPTSNTLLGAMLGQLRSPALTTVMSPMEPLVVAPQQGMAEPLAAQHWHRPSCDPQHLCHPDQHSWHGVWASIMLYL